LGEGMNVQGLAAGEDVVKPLEPMDPGVGRR